MGVLANIRQRSRNAIAGVRAMKAASLPTPPSWLTAGATWERYSLPDLSVVEAQAALYTKL